MSTEFEGKPEDRPAALLRDIIENTDALLKHKTREQPLAQLRETLVSFTPEETETVIMLFLKGLSLDNKQWDVDKRDAVLEILPYVSFKMVNKRKLLELYLGAVLTQDETADFLGSISSLLEAGKIMAPFFPPGENTREIIATKWGGVVTRFEEGAYTFIQERVEEIIATIPNSPLVSPKKESIPPMTPNARAILQKLRQKGFSNHILTMYDGEVTVVNAVSLKEYFQTIAATHEQLFITAFPQEGEFDILIGSVSSLPQYLFTDGEIEELGGPFYAVKRNKIEGASYVAWIGKKKMHDDDPSVFYLQTSLTEQDLREVLATIQANSITLRYFPMK